MNVNKNLYNFCAQNWDEVVSLLKKVADQQAENIATGVPVMVKFYQYFNDIFKIVNRSKVASPLGNVVLKMIPVNLLKNFVDNPTDKANNDELSIKIMLASAALSEQPSLRFYTILEMQRIVSGDFAYYNDLAMAYSLNRLYFGLVAVEEKMENLAILMDYLHNNGGVEMQTSIDWEAAVLFTMILQIVWTNFLFFTPEMQQLILKNYFFLAIVAGVPVKSLLAKYINASTEEERLVKEKFFFDCLQTSLENIPLDTSCTEWKKMMDVVKNYSVRLQGKQSSGFDQEEFVKGFYEGQEGRDAFRGWLRELLNIMFHLYE